MRSGLLCASLLGLCGIVAAARVPQGATQKTALVTVVTSSGGPMTKLTASDFVVRDDNAKREVVAAELATEPLFVVLLIDTTQPPIGVQAPTQDLRKALGAFVKAIKDGNPAAEIALMEFAGAAVTTLDFTAEASALDTTIGKLFPNRQTDAVLVEALLEAGRKLADKPSPRRAIVSIDFNSQDTSAPRTRERAVDDIRKSGSTVWSISVVGTTQAPSAREEVLNVVTRSSGGLRQTTLQPPGLESIMKNLANSLLSQYAVTFVRPSGASVKATKMEMAGGGTVLMTPWMR